LTTHLRPTAPIAADVLLPTDPGLALTLAQALLDKPLMANHSHGLWGYSGRDRNGRELTIQSTGIGGPSAAVVLTELAAHGARRAIRLGGCSALDPGIALATPLVADSALGADGASAALGGGELEPDPGLTEALASASGARAVTVASSDLFHDPERARRLPGWLAAGAAVADLESGALLAAGRRLGLAVAVGLVVTEGADGATDEAATERALAELAEVAAVSFGAAPAAAQPPASELPGPVGADAPP
jgi:uridine phosphorylase